MTFSADGKTLAMGVAAKPSVRFYEVDSAKEQPRIGYGGRRTFYIALSKDGKLAALAGYEKGDIVNALDVVIWDRERNEKLATESYDTGIIRCLAFAPDDKTVAVGFENRIRLWDYKMRNMSATWKAHGEMLSLAYSPDSKSLVSSGTDGTVKVWNLANWEVRQPGEQPPHPVHALAFTHDSEILIVGTADRLEKVGHDITLPAIGHIRPHRLLSNGGLSFWNATSGKALPPFPRLPEYGILCLALTADGKTLLSGSVGGSVWPRDLVAKKDRPPLFVTAEDEEYWLAIELGRRTNVPIMPDYSERVLAIAVSPDGKSFATACVPDRVQIWDMATGKVRHRLARHADVACLAFTPDGTRLAANDGGSVQFWDVASGRALYRLAVNKTAISCLAISSDGVHLAAGTNDRQVHLWTIGTEPVSKGVLIGHAQQVTAVAFNPDSRTLASASTDGTVRLWHVATAQPLATLDGHSNRINAIAFSPDGRTLASGGHAGDGNGEVFFWRAPSFTDSQLSRNPAKN